MIEEEQVREAIGKKFDTDDDAEIATGVIMEILGRFRSACNDTSAMIKQYRDLIKRVPFAITCSVSLGGEPWIVQVTGRGSEMVNCIKSIKELMLDGEKAVMESNK